MPSRHKHDFRIELEVNTEDAEKFLRSLDQFARIDAGRVAMQRVAVRGLQHALKLLDQLIYNTPERGGYKRTFRLRRGMRTFTRKEGNEHVLYILNDARSERGAPYPVYNELGTYEGATSPEDMFSQARSEVPSELVLMEFGRVAFGLEPRPFFFPTLAVMEYELPAELERALYERIRKDGFRA